MSVEVDAMDLVNQIYGPFFAYIAKAAITTELHECLPGCDRFHRYRWSCLWRFGVILRVRLGAIRNRRRAAPRLSSAEQQGVSDWAGSD